jgi:hypothetical protein
MATCRYPSCDEQARGSDGVTDASGGKFCSPQCELKYEHVKADAEDARREAGRRGR